MIVVRGRVMNNEIHRVIRTTGIPTVTCLSQPMLGASCVSDKRKAYHHGYRWIRSQTDRFTCTIEWSDYIVHIVYIIVVR